MEQTAANQVATPESVWAGLRELRELMKESEARVEREMTKFYREWAASRADSDRRMKEREEEREKERKASEAAYERRMKEREEEGEKERKASEAAYERRMKKKDETLGAWANNHGAFAEEYFYNSFEQGKRTFFGEPFDRIEKNLKPLDYVIKDEYDLVMVNGKSVAIIEVKFKAHEYNIPQVVKKAVSFRANYPHYARHNIYLGLASLSFYPVVEEECTKNGIAIIKQVGDTVVVNDAHLKSY